MKGAARLLAVLMLAAGSASAACPDNGAALKAAKWVVDDNATRQALAIGMLDCLALPDPVLRDDIGFEALQYWARGDRLDAATLQTMRALLLARLNAPDPQGFAQPFAALALAEVARADRRKPFLSAQERSTMVHTAANWLANVRDYRGFEEKEGWRHGVAHGADLMLQLSLNPALGKTDHALMLAAIAVQVSPPGEHFYRYGEGERLMAPVFYLARRDTLSAAEWEAWFTHLTEGSRMQLPVTQAKLARLHNLKGFLYPLYASLAESQDTAQRARLLPFVTKALKAVD